MYCLEVAQHEHRIRHLTLPVARHYMGSMLHCVVSNCSFSWPCNTSLPWTCSSYTIFLPPHPVWQLLCSKLYEAKVACYRHETTPLDIKEGWGTSYLKTLGEKASVQFFCCRASIFKKNSSVSPFQNYAWYSTTLFTLVGKCVHHRARKFSVYLFPWKSIPAILPRRARFHNPLIFKPLKVSCPTVYGATLNVQTSIIWTPQLPEHHNYPNISPQFLHKSMSQCLSIFDFPNVFTAGSS